MLQEIIKLVLIIEIAFVVAYPVMDWISAQFMK